MKRRRLKIAQLLKEVMVENEEESSWELLEVKDERLKMFNVKLNNDRLNAGSIWKQTGR